MLTVEHDPQEGEALLYPCLVEGKRLVQSPSLEVLRQKVAAQLACLPEHLRQLRVDPPYPVTIAPALRQLAQEVDRQTA
jgi:nicotinate phosphoribosyltransferase